MKFIVTLLVLIAGLLGAVAQATGPAAQNELIVKANAELSARNWPEAESLLKQLIAIPRPMGVPEGSGLDAKQSGALSGRGGEL